jgi:hypothetical protein
MFSQHDQQQAEANVRLESARGQVADLRANFPVYAD